MILASFEAQNSASRERETFTKALHIKKNYIGASDLDLIVKHS